MTDRAYNFTKGDWCVKFLSTGGIDDGDCDFFVHAQNGVLSYGTEIMMDDFGEHNGYPRDQRLADATLISCAPMLVLNLDVTTLFLQQIVEGKYDLNQIKEAAEALKYTNDILLNLISGR